MKFLIYKSISPVASSDLHPQQCLALLPKCAQHPKDDHNNCIHFTWCCFSRDLPQTALEYDALASGAGFMDTEQRIVKLVQL